MNALQKFESAFALEEFDILKSPVITPCLHGLHGARLDPMFATCNYRALVVHHDEPHRPLCVSHAIERARDQTIAVSYVCAAPTTPGRCCTIRISDDTECPQHPRVPAAADAP